MTTATALTTWRANEEGAGMQIVMALLARRLCASRGGLRHRPSGLSVGGVQEGLYRESCDEPNGDDWPALLLSTQRALERAGRRGDPPLADRSKWLSPAIAMRALALARRGGQQVSAGRGVSWIGGRRRPNRKYLCHAVIVSRVLRRRNRLPIYTLCVMRGAGLVILERAGAHPLTTDNSAPVLTERCTVARGPTRITK